jgi:hypothetical protein
MFMTTTRLVAAVSALALLSACGGETLTDAETPENSAQTEQTTPEPETVSASVEQAAPGQTLETGPITAANAKEALEKLAARDEKRRMYAYEAGQQIGAEKTALSWPYGTCTDAASLIPPPLEGWGTFSDISTGEWPITPENARITYAYSDETLDPNSAEYGASKHNISIYISTGTPNVDGIRQMYTEPSLRDVMLMPGPYNYPIQKTPEDYPGRTVLLGDYLVQLDGTGRDMDQYFEMIVKCGIDSGLIADGVDAASLQARP